MIQRRTVFSQLLSYIPKYEFKKCVMKYAGDYKVRKFKCWHQFLCMCFAQLTYRESLRDIEICLRAYQKKLYHIGLTAGISRSTLAEANENRDWRIYGDFAQILISIAKDLYKKDNEFELELENTVYALDSSTIDLCLSLFPWAKFRKKKGAIKLHTLLDLRGSIPTFICITNGKIHDVNILDILIPETGAFYVMDRGYIDFKRLNDFKEHGAFFLIRAKNNLNFRRLYSSKIDKSTGIRCDQTIKLKGLKSSNDYPDKLRRVKYFDKEKNKTYIYLTNNFKISAMNVADLYHNRWKIELFFKWVKQHLRIKSFYGNSFNAVCTQIWSAISVYVLVAIVKKTMKINLPLYTILQILSVSLFEQVSIIQLFSNCDNQIIEANHGKQLTLFDL